MRSSLVLAALGVSLIACSAAESKSARSDWQCAPKSVRNGETVTCTASAQDVTPAKEATNDPQAPSSGALFVRTYQVPSGSGSDSADSSDTSASAADSTPPPSSSSEGETENPGAPSGPDEYDCSVGGKNCPPPDALPPAPAPAGSGGATGGTAGGATGGAVGGATDYRCSTADDKTTCTRKTIECKEGTMQVGQECLVPGEAPTTPPASVGCTLTQGYWKTHADKWPTQMLTIGGVTYGQAELLTIFNTAPKGDTSLILAHQLIAAMLNAANGAGQTQVGSTIQAAQAWMSANKDADGRLPYGSTSAEAVDIGSKLDTYNNGGLDVPHCK